MPKVDIEQLSREEVEAFKRGQAGLAQKGALASHLGVASKRLLAPSQGGKAPLHSAVGKAPKRPRYEADADASKDDPQVGEEDEERIEVRNTDSAAVAAREREESLAALRREAAAAEAAGEQEEMGGAGRLLLGGGRGGADGGGGGRGGGRAGAERVA